MDLIKKLENKQTYLSVIGLGYVGLPIAQAFAHHFRVVGYDCNGGKIDQLKHNIDPAGEYDKESFNELDILFTTDENYLDKASVHIIAVPTPVDGRNHPNLNALRNATQTVAAHISKGDVVIYESTVYPGCTEEVCIPIIENLSGLKCNTDFSIGYSPERINPGDKLHTLKNVIKVVSASNPTALNFVSYLYKKIVDAGIHQAPSIKVAEAAKIIENTQRDVNIALMNELSVIFNKMNIETADVLSAASTKWNFLHFTPGLVGGHCIGVDPYYLDYKASELGYHTQIINRGRYVNDSMGHYVACETIKRMVAKDIATQNATALIIGLTYKANVSDIRNSKSVDIITELQAFGIRHVDVFDTRANVTEALQTYNITLLSQITDRYDTIIVAVAHDEIREMLNQHFFSQHLQKNGIVADVYGVCRELKNVDMWRL